MTSKGNMDNETGGDVETKSDIILVGKGAKNGPRDYLNYEITPASGDVIISNFEDTNVFLRGNQGDAFSYINPGSNPFYLGGSTKPFSRLYIQNIYIASASISSTGSSGMYDRGQWGTETQATYLNGVVQRAIFDHEYVAPSLGHITRREGTSYTYFENTSGETRRWLVTTSMQLADITGTGLLDSVTGFTIHTPNNADPDLDTAYPAFGGTVYGYTRNSRSGPTYIDVLSNACVVEIADGDVIAVMLRTVAKLHGAVHDVADHPRSS